MSFREFRDKSEKSFRIPCRKGRETKITVLTRSSDSAQGLQCETAMGGRKRAAGSRHAAALLLTRSLLAPHHEKGTFFFD